MLLKNNYQKISFRIKAFNFFNNFFTLNLVLHKTNIRLFQFDLHSEFKSLDHLLMEILIMIITYFVLY